MLRGGVVVTKTERMGRGLIETEQSNCMHVYQLAAEIYFEKKIDFSYLEPKNQLRNYGYLIPGHSISSRHFDRVFLIKEGETLIASTSFKIRG